MTRRVKAAVLGYYGRYNLGDDLMARDVAKALNDAGREVRMLSGAPYLAGLVGGDQISVAQRGATGVIGALVWCDEFIFAGGTIFHDSFIDEEFPGYLRHLTLYAGLFHLARLLRKKVRLIGVGLGPLHRDRARQVTRQALGAVNTLYVRDAASAAEAEALGLKTRPLIGPDLAFLGAPHLRQYGQSTPAENRLGLSLLDMAPFMAASEAENFWEPVREAAAGRLDAEQDLTLTLFAFWTAPGRSGDTPVAERFRDGLPATVRARVDIAAYDGDPDALIARLARCRAVLATRFHAAVLAQALGRPYAVISYNRKVSDFADMHDIPDALRLPGDRVSEVSQARAVIDTLLAADATPAADANEAARDARAAVNAALGEVDQ